MTDKASPNDVPFSLPEEKRLPGFFERLLVAPRQLGPVQLVLIFGALISVGLGLYHIFVAVFGPPEGRSFRSIHLSAMLVGDYDVSADARFGYRAPENGRE